MAITDKTRKILWGRSGNRCAICKHELVVDATPKDDESVIGDECHILSGLPNGPRNDQTFPENKLDSYENLILLCRIHHKMVDDQPETYTPDILRNMKLNHENWVAEKLNLNPTIKPIKIKRIRENIPPFMNRLMTGKEVLNIVDGCGASSLDHDELNTQEEVDLIGDFFQILQDWGDIGPELGASERVRVGFDLTQRLKGIEDAGFYVFGSREVRILEGGMVAPTTFPVVFIKVLRNSNPEIIGTETEKQGVEEDKKLKTDDV